MPKKYLDLDVDEDALPKSRQQGGKGGVTYGAPKPRGRPKGARTVIQNKPNPWLELVKKVRSQQPGMSYKEALKVASRIKAQHGYDESLGAGFDIGKFLSGAAKVVGKVAKHPVTKEVIKAVAPAAKDVAQEVGMRGISKVTGSKREDKPITDMLKKGATSVGKNLAHEGVKRAAEKMRTEAPGFASPFISKVEKSIHEKIGQGVMEGEEGKYLSACCKACQSHGGGMQEGGFIGPLIASLAPVVVPAAANLIGKLIKGKGVIPAGEAYHQTPTDRLHEAEPKKGKGVPGDYSYNELGASNNPFTGRMDEQKMSSSIIHKSIMGGNMLDTQKSDAPIDNTWATHAQLWWFKPVPGFMGRTELPANQFFMGNADVNLHIWEQANDVDQYINSAPTFEDGVTQIAPSTLTVNPREVSDMPNNSTIGSTIRDITSEARGQGGAGMVYAPGISLSKQAAVSNRFGSGLFTMPGAAGRGGDVTRVGYPGATGRGVIPPESAVTGTPIGVSQRGRGSMIKGSNIATWRT